MATKQETTRDSDRRALARHRLPAGAGGARRLDRGAQPLVSRLAPPAPQLRGARLACRVPADRGLVRPCAGLCEARCPQRCGHESHHRAGECRRHREGRHLAGRHLHGSEDRGDQSAPGYHPRSDLVARRGQVRPGRGHERPRRRGPASLRWHQLSDGRHRLGDASASCSP
jgi:hypothetical protein